MGGGGGAVRAILLDESVLFAQEQTNGNTFFQSGAESLLRRFQYSNIRTGISYGPGVSAQKVTFLQRIAMLYSLDSFLLNTCSIDVSLSDILLAWGNIQGTCLYVTSTQHHHLCHKLKLYDWFIVIKGAEDVGATENSKVLSINSLDELPLALCHFNRKASGESVVAVGYVMKPSREEDFAKRGAFPMHPTQNGLMFIPLTFNLPLASQAQKVDVVLHKATDEVVSIGLSNSSECSSRTTYSKGMQELERFFQDHSDCCVIDPLDNISPVLDRLRMQRILHGLENLKTDGHSRIHAPHFLKVDDFNDPNLGERLSEVNLFLPSIVKPQVACGVADAHNMAIMFRAEDFKSLQIPLPVVVQEYVDHHSSVLYKFYVLGEKVFYAIKKSTPNSDVFLSSYEKDGHKPIIFDSLKSLPTSKDDVNSKINKQSLDLALITEAANWLRKMLNLTIFGFDVVIGSQLEEFVDFGAVIGLIEHIIGLPSGLTDWILSYRVNI